MKDGVTLFWLGIYPEEIGLSDVKMFGFTASTVSNPKSPVPRGVTRRVVVGPAGQDAVNLSPITKAWLLGRDGRKGTNSGMVVELERLDEHDA